MDEKIALMVNTDGSFEVRAYSYGSVRQVSWGATLEVALQNAIANLGHALVIPISGPSTDF